MSYAESEKSDIPVEVIDNAKLNVFSLNTCQTGRQYGLFDNILDFIYRERPHVVLLQEVYEGSLERISNALGGQITFSRMCRLSLTDRVEEAEGWGVAIGSIYPLFDVRQDYYHGVREDSETIVLNNGLQSTSSLLQARLERGSARFNFATTHFTWHNRVEPSDEQLKDFKKLAVLLDNTPDVVLTGDFNSPRGQIIFDSIARMYRDNIPLDIETTNDVTVRPEATWRLVIDGFFTSVHYRAEDVRMVQGLSDHKGILGEVQKVAVS